MMHYPLLDTTEQYICGVVFKSETYKNIAVFKRTDFLGKPVEVLNIYIEPTIKEKSFSLLYLVIILPFGLFLFIFLKKRKLANNSIATLSKNKGSYYLNGHLLSEEFSVIDAEVLMHFLLAEENTLEIADINRILEYDNATIDAVKKRREQSIKNIREKLALYSNIPAENVFISSQHPQDRRIKRLKLNPILLQTTTK
jgi:hypothetical protein